MSDKLQFIGHLRPGNLLWGRELTKKWQDTQHRAELCAAFRADDLQKKAEMQKSMQNAVQSSVQILVQNYLQNVVQMIVRK